MARLEALTNKSKNIVKKISKKARILMIIFVVSLVLFWVLSIVKNSLVGTLYDQKAYLMWSEGGAGSTQVSMYFDPAVKINDFAIGSVKNLISKELSDTLNHDEYVFDEDDPFAGPFTSSYCAFGKVNISSSETTQIQDVNAVGIGDEFFSIHPLDLKTGQFFSGNDLMKDKVILDSNTAFALFGSYDCIGLTVRIGDMPHIVSGVYDPDQSKLSKIAGSDGGYIFISCESLSNYGTTDGITNIEIVATEPVSHYIYQVLNNTEKTKFPQGSYEIVENSTRFSMESILSNVILNYPERTMRKNKIVFPYWENIARVYENYCAVIVVFQLLCLLVALIIAMYAILSLINNSEKLFQFIKKHLSIVILLFIPIFLTGCGNKEDTTNNLYKLQNLEIDGISSLTGYTFMNDGSNVIFYGESDSPDYGKEAHFVIFDYAGNVTKHFVYQEEEGSQNNYFVSKDGYIYAINYISSDNQFSLQEYVNEPNDMDNSDMDYSNTDIDYSDTEYSDEEYSEADTSDSDYTDNEEAYDEEVDNTEDSSEGKTAEESTAGGNDDSVIDISVDAIKKTDEEIKKKDSENTASQPKKEEGENQDKSDEEHYDGDDKEKELYLTKADFNGKNIATINLSKRSETCELFSDDYNPYRMSLIADENNTYALYDKKLIILDNEFNTCELMETGRLDKNILEATLSYNNNGDIYAIYTDTSYDIFAGKVDLANGKITKSTKFENEKYYCNVYRGLNYDFLINKGSIIYGVDLEKGYSKIADLTLSDISTDYIPSICEIDNDHFMAVYSSIADDNYYLGYFTKTDKLESATKTTITIAMTSSDYSLKRAVAKFNSENNDYSIRIMDYSAIYGGNDNNVAIEKLNTDIITGNMPDLLVTSTDLPINTYINKGLLEDIYPYFENDPDIDIEDYNTHIFDLYSKDGKLYRLVPSYSLRTVAIKAKYAKGRTSWSVEEAQKTMAEAGTELFFPFSDRKDVLNNCMIMANSQFINWETGECNFDGEEFKEMLKFIKSFPTQQELETSGQWSRIASKYDVMFRSDLVLCEVMYVQDFVFYQSEIKGQFGEDVTLIGFPNDVGMGNSIAPGMSISMSSKTKEKEACWEFMKFLLSEDFQRKNIFEFPVSNVVFNEKLDSAKEEMCFIYEYDGVVEKFPLTFYLNGIEIPIPPFTEEEANYIVDVINKTTNTSDTDPKILSIIAEECQDYFEGRATVDEVANRVQSRAQIYLYESQ